MPTELDALLKYCAGYREVYVQCAQQAHHLGWFRRLLAHSWLGEINGQLLRLERMSARLEGAAGGTQEQRDAAWQCLQDVAAALSPAALPGGEPGASDIRPVASRLLAVLSFLVLQILGAIALFWFTLGLIGNADLQTLLTREQWEERRAARAEVVYYRGAASAAMAADILATKICPAVTPAAPVAPPATRECQDARRAADATALRASIEELVATLGAMRLADRDLRLANRYLDQVLVALDDGYLDRAARHLVDLDTAFAGDPGDEPPSSTYLIVLGSLLGMLTITIHLNWKFRNRWDTVGFLPWYATRLVAAPILSLAALGLLFQVSFTTDLTAASDLSALGLRGANPLTIFAVAVISGLFSNRVYDWLRGIVGAAGSGSRSAPGSDGSGGGAPAAPSGGGGSSST